jgi:hypothetical protein
VKLVGGFAFDGQVDLSASSITLRSVLDETSGAGELAKGFQGADLLPLTLVLSATTANSAIYVRPDTTRPNVQLTIVLQAPGLYLATLRLTRASIPTAPELCSGNPPTTFLDTAFVIDDGTNPPVTVAGPVEWLCQSSTQSLRVLPSGGSPTPTPGPTPTPVPTSTPVRTATPVPTATSVNPTPTPNKPTPTPTKKPTPTPIKTPTPTPIPTPTPTPTPTPVLSTSVKASIRINLLTRQTGQPSQVLLDGSQSTDSGGTITAYTFSVARSSDGVLVYGPTTVSQSSVTTTIDLGSYNAILTVQDDHNRISAPDMRGFSIH